MDTLKHRREIIVVDTSIADYQHIIDAATQKGIEVLCVSGDEGLEGLAKKIQQYEHIDTLHLVSHGSAGQIHVGKDTLSSGTLAEHESHLSLIKSSLSDEGELLIYGCDVASGEQGQQFVELLSQTLSKDVAASNDLTGSFTQGGNWRLEEASGAIESKAIRFDTYSEVLALSLGDTRVDIETSSSLYSAPGYSDIEFIGDSLLLTYDDYTSNESVSVLVAPDGTLSTVPSTTLSPRTNDNSDTITYKPLSDGNILVNWYSSSSSKGFTDNYFKIIDTSGNEVVGATKINSAPGSLNRFTDIAELSNGNIAFVWATDGSNYALRRFDKNGTAVDTDQLSVTSLAGTSGSQYTHHIAANDAGQFMIAWYDYDSPTYLGMVFEDGASTPTQVNGQNRFSIGESKASGSGWLDLKALPDGRFVVSFKGNPGGDPSTRDARFTIFEADGSSVFSNDVILGDLYSWGNINGPLVFDDALVFDYSYINLNDTSQNAYYTKAYNFDGTLQTELSGSVPSLQGEDASASAFRDIDGNLSWLINDDPDGNGDYDLWLLRQDTVVPQGSGPSAPGTPDLQSSSDTGISNTDNLTSDDTPVLNGSGSEPAAQIKVYKDGVVWGSPVTADGSGNWTFSAPDSLADGDYDITVTQTVDSTESVASDALRITVDTAAPTVTSGNISFSGATGTDGAFKVGDTVTATWNNTAGGDNNSDTISAVTMDFSAFGGGASVAATNSSGTWTATYTVVSGAIDGTNKNVAVTATDDAGNTATTADTTNATVDNQAPTVTDGNISVTSTGSGTGGTFITGDTVTVEWSNAGDGNSDIATALAEFIQFGGMPPVPMIDVNGNKSLFRASYTITAGSIDGANLNISVMVSDDAGNTASSFDSSGLSVDNQAPTVTDSNLSISGATGAGGAFIVGDTVTATWNNTAGGDNNSDIASVTLDFSAFGGGAAVAASNSSGTWTATYTITENGGGTIDATGLNVSATATDDAGHSTTTADTTGATVDNVSPGTLTVPSQWTKTVPTAARWVA